MYSIRPVSVVLLALALLGASCGSDSSSEQAASDRPAVVVTTNILGDVVESLSGGAVDVVTIMPLGADPHDFQASARQADEIRSAEVLIVNGGGFEEGLIDVIEGAEADGVATFEALEAVAVLDADGGHDDHHDDEHADDEHGDEEHDEEGDHDEEADHAHDGTDPHFFTDPARMADVVAAIAAFLIDNVEGIDASMVETASAEYIDELRALDTDIESMVAAIAAEDRVLVTNHEVFGYFADRYGFEVIGTVIPGGSSTDTASAGALAALAEIIEDEGVPAIFADASSSDDLAQTLAAEVGDIDVVELYSESLGDADSDGATYLAMVRANAERITAALGG